MRRHDTYCSNSSCSPEALAGERKIAVGTHIAMRPPHETVRADFPHTASTSGI